MAKSDCATPKPFNVLFEADMNCKEFDNVVNDLAQAALPAAPSLPPLPSLVDTSLREQGLAHAESCQTCAARLRHTRELIAGLKLLAADAEDKSAPPRIEASLLAAFRQQSVQPASNVIALFTRQGRQRQVRVWALAAAAAVLVACAIAASFLLKDTSKESAITNSTKPLASPEATPRPSAQQKQEDIAFAEIAEPDGKPVRKPRRKSPPRRSVADHSSVVASIGEFVPVGAQGTAQEVTTDFLPLAQALDSQPLESGQLIRVEMPRSTLASFGLPINPERANVPVKADVLLAEDGSARAIRFVR
jgi:hypothetical protein